MAAPEHAPAAESPAVASTRGVDIAVSAVLLALAGLLAIDNWRTGMGWDATGPQAGYFPFYLSLILAGSAIYGIFKELAARRTPGEAFVRRVQLRRGGEGLGPALPLLVLLPWLGPFLPGLPPLFRLLGGGGPPA